MLRTRTTLDVDVSDTTVRTSAWAPLAIPANVGLQLTTTGTLHGTWAVFVTNKPDNDSAPDPTPSDITSAFTLGSGTAIAAPAGSPTSQYVQLTVGPLNAAALMAQFTPTSGSGHVRVSVAEGFHEKN